MRGALLATLALLTGSACAGPPLAPAATPSSSPPATPDPPAASLKRVCSTYGVPAYIRFACKDATLSFTGRHQSAEEVLDYMLRSIYRIYRITELERIEVVGFQSFPEDGPPFVLAQRRAETVAREMVRRGVDPDLIETVVLGAHYGASDEPDPCPPREEDQIGDRRRSVFVNVRFCREPEPEAPAGQMPAP